MSSSSPSEVPLVALVVGSETTLRDAAVRELREAALGSGPRDFNEDRFDFASAGTSPAAIVNACRTLPMMNQRRLVLVTGLADRRAATFLDEVLIEYLEAPAESACLVLESPKADRRKRWAKRLAETGRVFDCEPPKRPADIRAWIEKRIEDQGKRPGRGASAALQELVGGDLDRLSFEVDKVCLYLGEAPEVGAEDVAAVTASLRPRAIYELTDAIGQQARPSALKLLHRLLDQGEAPLAVLGALANHFRRLIRAQDCRPMEPSNVQKTLQLHPFAAKKLVDQARRFRPARLRYCLAAIRQTDEALKGAVPLAPSLAIERLVIAICR